MSTIFKDESFIRLRSLAPNAKFASLICLDIRCSNNFGISTTLFEEDKSDDSDWLLHLSCSVCKSEWAICRVCNKFKNKMTSNRMIGIHRSTCHGKTKKRKQEHIEMNNNDKKNKSNNNDDIETANIQQLDVQHDVNIEMAKIGQVALLCAQSINDNIETAKHNQIALLCAQSITKIVPNDTTNPLAKASLDMANIMINNNKIMMALKNDHPALFPDDDGDYVVTSSQLEYDVTVGSSVGDENTVEIINDNNILVENNIAHSKNDETTVTEADSVINDNLFTKEYISKDNSMVSFNLVKDIQDSLKIKSLVSLLLVHLRYINTFSNIYVL